MRKIHVLTRKEDIFPDQVSSCSVVAIDVLFATSTIAVALSHGFKEVIPVMDEQEARKVAAQLPKDSFILAGEDAGYTIKGFIRPDPILMTDEVYMGKTLILSTTNGTVAVRKARKARRLFTSSLLNASSVADVLTFRPEGENVLIVAAGSIGSFAYEDFLGAGFLTSQLLQKEGFDLTDAAKAALNLYENDKSILKSLRESATGKFLKQVGWTESIDYVSKKNIYHVVPKLVEDSNGVGRLIDQKKNHGQ